MVAMNPQTWDTGRGRDRARRLPALRLHQADAGVEVPRRHHGHRHAADRDRQRDYTDPRQRQLFKNIIYVGALSALLDIDAERDREALRRAVSRARKSCSTPTCRRCSSGRDYAHEHLRRPIGLQRASASDNVGDQIFIDGNSAAALGCVYGGATVAAWYPITPSSSLAEAFQKYCHKFRVDPDTGKQQVRHRAGRGRARLDRHGGRRRLERRARLHRDVRARASR